MPKKVIVIGAGFAGLAAATSLAHAGFEVLVLEKNDQAGGRARIFKQDGFLFDMGPSWYWMPDVFERYFAAFGKKPSDYYDLIRLDPSYKVIFPGHETWDVPADLAKFKALLESVEPGASQNIDAFLKEAAYKYEVGVNDIVYKPSVSPLEYLDARIAKGMLKLHLFKAFSAYVRKFFKDERIIKLMEFPVLFLGAKPEKTPALYSIMNYADIQLGTWYPMGGMHMIVKGMQKLAEEKGVKFKFNSPVTQIISEGKKVKGVQTAEGMIEADFIVAGADYHHVEQKLIKPDLRKYDAAYWNNRVMAPSCLLFYLGVDEKIPRLDHHNLFFDEDFGPHAEAIYDTGTWAEKPLFYVCCPSKTDASVAPAGKENLFILIPAAPGISDPEEIREKYYNLVMDRLEKYCGVDIKSKVIFKRSFAQSNFIEDYNSFKGNAYGLANTLLQTAFLKPKMYTSKIRNMVYTGQLTTPGPGVPPSLISGQVAAREIIRMNNKLQSRTATEI
jgi:phytoene desaturase